MKNVYVVIPSYNEGETLRKTVESLLPCGYEIIVVDDGSREDPHGMLADLPIHYLRHPINLGQGAALQTGMDYAKAQGAEAVIHFDADGQHDKNDIPQFLAALEAGADVVIGSRFLRESDLAQVPKRKRLLLRCARIVNGVFTGMWLTDAHNGFRALGRKALEAIDLTENRMAHATEIMSQIRAAKLTVKEVPVTIRYTDYSQAKKSCKELENNELDSSHLDCRTGCRRTSGLAGAAEQAVWTAVFHFAVRVGRRVRHLAGFVNTVREPHRNRPRHGLPALSADSLRVF